MPGVSGYKYVYSLGHITSILQKIQDTARPEKLTITHVQKSWLLKDAKYSAVLDLLREMKFIDEAGIPLDLYAEYQNKGKSKKALAKGIRNAYQGIFNVYPNAFDLSREEVNGFIKEHTGLDQSVIDKVSATFFEFCKLADFSDDIKKELTAETTQENHKANSTFPIAMNIQIVVPSDATEEQYERIFKSIRKFLNPE